MFLLEGSWQLRVGCTVAAGLSTQQSACVQSRCQVCCVCKKTVAAGVWPQQCVDVQGGDWRVREACRVSLMTSQHSRVPPCARGRNSWLVCLRSRGGCCTLTEHSPQHSGCHTHILSHTHTRRSCGKHPHTANPEHSKSGQVQVMLLDLGQTAGAVAHWEDRSNHRSSSGVTSLVCVAGRSVFCALQPRNRTQQQGCH